MSKHTEMHIPGPWSLQPIGDESECNILGPSRELIATVSDNDAKLIAAAPDLLAACKTAEATYQGHFGPSHIATILRAAIAKATS